MSDTYRVYQYDYAGYYRGIYRDIPIGQGYYPGPLTDVPVPSIPEGHFAVFDGAGWFLTTEPEPSLPPPVLPELQEPIEGPQASGPIPTVV